MGLKSIYIKLLRIFLSLYIIDYVFSYKKIYNKCFNIHVIGDSHVSVFSGINKMQDNWPLKSRNIYPPFKSYRIGAVTAYNSSKKLSVIKKILTFKSSGINKKKDYIMLCFGEIDIRVHLIKQKKKQEIDENEIVKKCIDRYFITIQTINNWGYKVIILGPVASSAKDIVIDNYSSFGTTQERNYITLIFNKYLENKCIQNKIPFINIFEEMVDEEYNTKTDLLLDDIHLSSKALPIILEKLNKTINMYE